MTREEYYKQKSKERFERFCKWLDLHYYIILYSNRTCRPSKLLTIHSEWSINSLNKTINFKHKLHEIEPLNHQLIPTTFRRVLLEGCRRLNINK